MAAAIHLAASKICPSKFKLSLACCDKNRNIYIYIVVLEECLQKNQRLNVKMVKTGDL